MSSTLHILFKVDTSIRKTSVEPSFVHHMLSEKGVV